MTDNQNILPGVDSMQVKNPLIWADFPDPDIIRVKDTYYMVSTTMFVMPGGPVLRSKDLCHWELVSYIFDTIEDNHIYRMENGSNAYGKGQWATSLLYHQGMYYACFTCHDMKKTYIYYTDDVENSGWNRHVLDGSYHDMSFLVDEGRAYLIYGNGDIHIVRLDEELSGIKAGETDRLLFSTPSKSIKLRCEGCRAYKINGWYYLLFIEWPEDGNGRRRVVGYRSKELLGQYERRILLDDDMGYKNQGVAQGALIDTPEGEWYALLFQDHGAVGRIPCLLPVTWEEHWPVMGIDHKVPKTFATAFLPYEAGPLVISDSFNHSEDKLDLRWQWNHNPEKGCWSFTQRPGYLRLHTRTLAEDLLKARNLLTQRTFGPKCSFSVELDSRGMKEGDYAGLAAFQSIYGAVGVKVCKGGAQKLVVSKRDKSGRQKEEESILLENSKVFLKIAFDFTEDRDIAQFFYSCDGYSWSSCGTELKMEYTLDLFIGYRIALFNYSEKEAGGYADFRNFQKLAP